MAQITSNIGLVSGINTGAIIDELISLDSAPITLLQSRITGINNQKQAYTDLTTALSDIQTIGNSLALPQTFQAATANSSDPNTLTATAAVGAAIGTYQMQVSRLVTTQQSITSGFATTDSTPIGAGTITLEQGGGEAFSLTSLSSLNGGAGVNRGQFRITDRSGNNTVIDTSDAVSLDDVVKKINSAVNISVHAQITPQGLVLTDQTGKTASDLIVQDLGGGTSAKDLGIAGDSTSNTLTGTAINYIGRGTALSQLNDGRGIRTTTAGQTDFSISAADGTRVNVSLASAQTVGDVIDAINTAAAGKVKADLIPGSTSLRLTDTSGGGGTLAVTAQNSSKAAQDLGLGAAPTGNVITGNSVLAGIDSVLLSSLRGGTGVPLGSIFITDRAGHTGSIDLNSATSVSDVINAINTNTSGIQVTASLNKAGTGLQVVDSSGGSGNLVIGDATSTTAGVLGIAGTCNQSTQVVSGGNLQRQYISENTALNTYSAGKAVGLGQFQITNSAGSETTVDLGGGTFNTVGDVIRAINAKNLGVTASINTNGNGLLLTDTAGGTQKLTVTDLGGTTASDLNIAGAAAGRTIDGGFQKTISVTSTDTLASVQTKINQSGFGVSANIVNDGSGANPFRLSLTSYNSGRAGRVLIDGGSTNLAPTNLVQGQDAAVFFGGDGTSQPLLVTSNSNQLANVIKGVTVNLVNASKNPVTLSITRDPSAVSDSLQKFTTDFNTLVDKINTDTQFDSTTNQAGVLLGDSAVDQVESKLYTVLNTVVKGAGKYKILADVGITIGDGAKLSFDPSKFTTAFATDATSVQNLFSQVKTGLGNVMAQAITNLTDPVNGIVTLETNTLSTQVQQFQDRITDLNSLLANKRTQLQAQFANMETVLSGLNGQQQALATLSGLSTVKSTTSTSSTGK